MSGADGWRAALIRHWYRPSASAGLLAPLALGFGAIAGVRRRWLERRAERLPVPVIVVGNIAVGGAGKTPFVVWLVERLREWGWKPGVVSRGYGGRAAAWPQRVEAGSDPAQLGDEPVLIARRTGAPVTVGPDRPAAARLLLADGGVDVIVSDDGLQHYRLARDVEIAVVDASRGLGNGRLLPAGPLREPPARLAEVALVVVNGPGWTTPAGRQVEMRLAPSEAVRLDGGDRQPLAAFAGRAVHAVAGIGNPARFFSMLSRHQLRLVMHPFPDHHPFLPADLDFGDELPVLMTEKDAVKCRPFARAHHWVVPVDAGIAAAGVAAVQELCDSLRR